MKYKRIVVLGGGISGLSLAWFLSQKGHEVLLLEKEERVGGLMGRAAMEEFFFERGPRMFSEGRSKALLALIDELGLRKEIIYADEGSKARYIWHDKRLRPVPSNPLAALFSPLTRPLLFALLTEWKKKPVTHEESIWDFALRRLNQKTAERLIDPLVAGIYAGDIKRLSVNACFPELKKWEKEQGSLTRGFFAAKRESSRLFSLRGGSERLIQKLEEKLRGKIHCGQAVIALSHAQQEITVTTHQQRFQADHVFSALPPNKLCALLNLPEDFPMAHMATVNIAYHSQVLNKKGFGYLVPRSAGEDIFGVVFDSNLFPQQNSAPHETRLTVMLPVGGDEKTRAQNALARHLQIYQTPDYIQSTRIANAIPQFELGHAARIEKLKRAVLDFSPRLHLVGNFLVGPSVNDAVASSRDCLDPF